MKRHVQSLHNTEQCAQLVQSIATTELVKKVTILEWDGNVYTIITNIIFWNRDISPRVSKITNRASSWSDH